MWRLLISEINYNKLRTLIVAFFGVICFTTIWFGVKWEQNRIFMPMLIMLIAVMAVIFLHQKDSMRTKQIRLHINLPLPLWQIGIIERIYPILIWFLILILYFCIRLIIGFFTDLLLDAPSTPQLLTMNGIILLLYAFIFLTRNINVPGTKRQILIRLLWAAALIAALLPFYVITNTFGIFGENTSVQQNITQRLQSPLGVNALGVCLYGFEYLLFLKRKSYLEF